LFQTPQDRQVRTPVHDTVQLPGHSPHTRHARRQLLRRNFNGKHALFAPSGERTWCGRARVASPQGYVQGQGTTLTAGRRRAGPAQLPPRTCPSRNDQIMHVPRYNDSAMRAPAVTFKAQCPRAMPARSSMPAPKPGGYLRAARTRGLLRLSRVPPPFECSHARLPRLPHPAAALVKAHGCEAQQTRPRDVHRAAHALPLGRVVHGSADPLREELRHGV